MVRKLRRIRNRALERLEARRRKRDRAVRELEEARDEGRHPRMYLVRRSRLALDALRKTRAVAARALKRLRRARRRARRVIGRSEWGAARPRGSYAPRGRLELGIQHHSADRSDRIRTRAEERAYMRAVQRSHFYRGFIDIGYGAVVFPSGRIYQGRPFTALGAHVRGHNTGSIGICCAGNFEIQTPTSHAIVAVRRIRAQIVPALKRVPYKGHKDLEPNLCPGRHLYPYVKEKRL